jgi:putative ABC transport system substrate-binding protein
MTVDTGWEPAIAGDAGRRAKDGAKPRTLRGFAASESCPSDSKHHGQSSLLPLAHLIPFSYDSPAMEPADLTRRISHQLERRSFIGMIVGSLLAAPLAIEAQPAGKVYKIGYLTVADSFSGATRAAFDQGLREHGWLEGQNFVLMMRFAQFRSAHLPELVAELVQQKADVIVVSTAEAALAAKHGTQTIPIVAVDTADAVAIGLVANLARPGGNVTGLSYLGTELVGKQVDLLKEAVPTLSRVAILTNPHNPTHLPRMRAAESAAQGLRVNLDHVEVWTPAELDKAFALMKGTRVGGVLVLSDPMFNVERSRLIQLASKSGLPAMYGFRIWVDAGGLMSYGPDFQELNRRAAVYVDKILKGAKPGDLPVEQPTKFELVINLKTVKALRLTLPQSLLGRADEIIQ